MFLMASLIFSAGYYSGPIFYDFEKALVKFVLINLIGVNFEAGNEKCGKNLGWFAC